MDKIKEILKKIRLVDFIIIITTIKKVFIRSDITKSTEEIDVTLDYGDALLKTGKITKKEFDEKLAEARELLCKR